MTYYPDFSPYAYLPSSKDIGLALNIGWLSKAQPYSQGKVPDGFIERLWLYCEQLVNRTRGFSSCELCLDSIELPVIGVFQNKKINLGSAEIRVVSNSGKIFASPNLIYHYVASHQYLPPREFIEAVLTGYLPNSPEYKILQGKYGW